jgi:hypothetical protein
LHTSLNIIDKLPDMVSVRDELTKTQFAYYNTTMGGMVSFERGHIIFMIHNCSADINSFFVGSPRIVLGQL